MQSVRRQEHDFWLHSLNNSFGWEYKLRSSLHTSIPFHRLQRSWHSSPGWVNAGNKNTPSMHYPQRWKVTTSVAGLKQTNKQTTTTPSPPPPPSYWHKNVIKNGESQRVATSVAGLKQTNKQTTTTPPPPPPHCHIGKKMSSKMANPRDVAGNAKELFFFKEEEKWKHSTL